MNSPMYIIAGRVRSTGKAELRLAYSLDAYKAEVVNMSDLLALPWTRREELSSLLVTLAWLKPAERRALSRRIKAVTNIIS